MEENNPQSTTIICPRCHFISQEDSYFCPNCGNKLRIKPPSTSWIKQIGVYALSFFLPPLGLWPAVKYLKQPDRKSKIIGGVAVFLTVVSLVLTVITFNQMYKTVSQQMQIYENAGGY